MSKSFELPERVRGKGLERDLADSLDLFNLVIVAGTGQHHVHSTLASPARPACTVDEGLHFPRRLGLDHQLDVGKVESASSHIGSNDSRDLAAFEVTVDLLSVELLDISV